MKNLICIMLIHSSTLFWGQSNRPSVSEDYLTDSVHRENIVEFYTDYDMNFHPHDAVRFKVKITNLGSKPLPNLIRVSNRSQYLKLLYNGEDSHDLGLSNGMEAGDWPWSIAPGESDEFQSAWVLDKHTGLFLYEQPLNVTWEYMGVSSSTEIVDLRNKKVF